MDKVKLEDLKKKLSSEQYGVCFLEVTEAPFFGKYTDNHDEGQYQCAVCSTPLFSSDTKFDSGTGWPAFWKVQDNKNIRLETDNSHGMTRTAVYCANCGAKLRHILTKDIASTPWP